ncbi:MAG: hypothetical protein H6584_08820 [Flavobacteriales bacterium]|nr:hypothetical protein [Flavobacteriales bacterium]
MLQKVVSDSLNIIVAGDSRAERQLIPKIIKTHTGINSINVAVSAGDLALTVPALSAYSDSDVFVISASSWQINDGAIDHGYLSYKCFQQIGLVDKIKLYRNDTKELLNMYAGLFTYVLRHLFLDSNYSYDEEVIKEEGFMGIQSVLKVNMKEVTHLIGSHSWYKNINSKGCRFQVLIESLNRLDEKGSLVFIYQPPVSPIWKEQTKNTEIGMFEKEYSKKLDSLCAKSDNIIFYDFYSTDISQLKNEMYYDYQHLNRKGAEVFSKLISEKIKLDMAKYSKQYSRK